MTTPIQTTVLVNGVATTATVEVTVALDPITTVGPPPPLTVPGAPTKVVAVAGNGQATVVWAAPNSNGGAPISGYTVTASPGGAHVGVSAVATSGVVAGLTNDTAYSFTVTATNSVGVGPASAASLSVTPIAPPPPPPPPTGGARLFADTSLWNTRKSGLTFVSAADGTLKGANYGVNSGAFCHPTYFAKSSDPVTTFHLGVGWGYPATTITAPAPSGMNPASGSDGALTLLFADGRLLDMYGAKVSGSSVTALFYGLSDGVNGPGFGDPNSWHAIGTTAIGSPQGAGTILARDIAAGVIAHGLCMAWDYSALGGKGTSGNPSVLPAVSNDAGGGGGPLPEGGLLVIPPGTAKPGGLSAMGSALWDAASTYGVYITDQLGGGPMFYSDGSSTVNSAISGNDYNTVGRALRLVKTW